MGKECSHAVVQVGIVKVVRKLPRILIFENDVVDVCGIRLQGGQLRQYGEGEYKILQWEVILSV